jgi:Asp-tRNA(Asn)/Glu-tRNA(Gln) amidotransferase A subunit family amidase
MTTELNSLSATAIATGVADGSFTAEAVTAACLDHIAAREDTVGAWEFLDPELALTQARGVDAAEVKGPLAGVPVGVKDIIDTHDMPTGMGSPIYDGHRPSADASCVAQMRAAGAVILGKTVTCEFAGLTPRKTTNPHDPTRTPGGSSSGSAAAVADEMIPLAFGTQTGGSVLRPSSYCGIIGYKPSFDTFSLTGIYPAAESLDTLGLHARSLDDIELASATLLRRPFAPWSVYVKRRCGIRRSPRRAKRSKLPP